MSLETTNNVPLFTNEGYKVSETETLLSLSFQQKDNKWRFSLRRSVCTLIIMR
jgi:hypothetical protein